MTTTPGEKGKRPGKEAGKNTPGEKGKKAGKKIVVLIRGEKALMTAEEIRSLMGQLAASLRKTHGFNAFGRPRNTDVERCACGEMTLARAKRRYHVCGEKAGKKQGTST